MLGEFRTSLSDMLFIKTERYLHSGVAYVPHLTEQLLTVEGSGKQADEHDHANCEDHDHDHFDHEDLPVTVVPVADEDYRGWIGRMHREVKPWRDPSLSHQHTTGTELIPWFRMMTLSDPAYTRGYTIGAFWIKQHDPAAAMAFVEEGLHKNPRAFELHLTKGFLLVQESRRVEAAGGDKVPLLLQARDSFQSAAEYMIEVRPRKWEGDIEDVPGWGGYQENDARAAAHMAVLLESQHGDPEKARALARRYLDILPDHPQLPHYL
jgi:tetratricopeptide (TPR) repeat protein